MDLFVDDKCIGLFGLGFLYLDGVAGLEVFQVRDLEFQQVAGSDSVVDTKDEKKEVSGSVEQQGFDGLNVLGVLDGE